MSDVPLSNLPHLPYGTSKVSRALRNPVEKPGDPKLCSGTWLATSESPGG